MSLAEMIAQCEENPILSRPHEWLAGEQADYDSLKSRGRTLYDNLRTQFDVGHADAYTVAGEQHGARATFN